MPGLIDTIRRLRPAMAVLVLLGSGRPATTPAGLPVVRANDNRARGGRLSHDTLTIRLVVRMAEWRPEADSGPAIDVAAFAEEGRAPSIPGPLIRVRAGTVIVATVRNALPDSTLTIRGLQSRPALARDSLVLRPGESREVRFVAGAPGTYYYMAVVGLHDFDLDDEREQTSGALVIDPPGGSRPDRILMINIWGQSLDSTHYRNALAINGRSWPYDERITAMVGDTVRWRVVNPTNRPHPMHLHGFYFQVLARGTRGVDTVYGMGERRTVVTESLREFDTMDLSWVPDRPGNWLFHCHIGFHVVPGAATLDPSNIAGHDRMSGDPRRHMAGLVLGISVRAPKGWSAPTRIEPRRLRLLVQEGARRGRSERALGFVLQTGAVPAPDSIEIPGTALFLTRGQPTDIIVVNRLKEPAAIHWHGIELESFSDGVAGWSGMGRGIAAPIEPGDSFLARLTLPRSGTFIYHSHMNDLEQLTSGLYGAIVVLEPGERFDPATDHLFVLSWDGPADPAHFIVNGDSLPPPLELTADTRHRLRFINIAPANRFPFSIRQDTTLVSWHPVAKDGADLPALQTAARPARQAIDVGETYDFEWSPRRGEYRLILGDPARPLWQRRIIVR